MTDKNIAACVPAADDGAEPPRRCRDNHRHYGHCLVWRCGCDCPNPDRDE